MRIQNKVTNFTHVVRIHNFSKHFSIFKTFFLFKYAHYGENVGNQNVYIYGILVDIFNMFRFVMKYENYVANVGMM